MIQPLEGGQTSITIQSRSTEESCVSQVWRQMATCALTATPQAAAEIMRSISTSTPRAWKTWIHGGRRNTKGAELLTVPKKTCLTWVSPEDKMTDKIKSPFWWYPDQYQYDTIPIWCWILVQFLFSIFTVISLQGWIKYLSYLSLNQLSQSEKGGKIPHQTVS